MSQRKPNRGSALQAISYAIEEPLANDAMDFLNDWWANELAHDDHYFAWLKDQPKAIDQPVPERLWAGLARDLVMWMERPRPTPHSLFEHLRHTGKPIPQWLREEPEMQHSDHVPSKGTRAVLIYKAMRAEADAVCPSSDAAIFISEEAFRAGFEAAQAANNPNADWYDAWSAFEPSETAKDLVV